MLGVTPSQSVTVQIPYSFIQTQYAIFIIASYKEIENVVSEDDLAHLSPILEFLNT